MTEHEYSAVRALSSVIYAHHIMADIRVENVPQIVHKDYRAIMIGLGRMRDSLFSATRITEDEADD